VSGQRFLDAFVAWRPEGLQIQPEQASRFAKEVAGDFNPIHDPESRRFCVPGDLLFALVLARYGISERMHCRFVGMVGAGVDLRFPDAPEAQFAVTDAQGRQFLEVEREGPVTHDPGLIEAITRAYVAFSGQNFPHVLVPLLEQHQVMVNPDRPLVMYDRMSLALGTSVGAEALTGPLQARLEQADMTVDGKRGEVRLDYALCHGGQPFATGSKHLLLGGLRPWDGEVMRGLVEEYAGWKARYAAGKVGG
jgi:hypothetical protein